MQAFSSEIPQLICDTSVACGKLGALHSSRVTIWQTSWIDQAIITDYGTQTMPSAVSLCELIYIIYTSIYISSSNAVGLARVEEGKVLAVMRGVR